MWRHVYKSQKRRTPTQASDRYTRLQMWCSFARKTSGSPSLTCIATAAAPANLNGVASHAPPSHIPYVEGNFGVWSCISWPIAMKLQLRSLFHQHTAVVIGHWPDLGCPMLQEHYEKLKAARDSAEHLCDETARQLARTEKQLSEAQHAVDTSMHEVPLLLLCWLSQLERCSINVVVKYRACSACDMHKVLQHNTSLLQCLPLLPMVWLLYQSNANVGPFQCWSLYCKVTVIMVT